MEQQLLDLNVFIIKNTDHNQMGPPVKHAEESTVFTLIEALDYPIYVIPEFFTCSL